MNIRRTAVLALAALALVTASGCAVMRGQEGVGAFVEDSTITAAVKGSFAENRVVDAAAISVETLNGTVMLSGFAKSANEKTQAEALAWKIQGVKQVKNQLAIRP